jgi:hypothetical protein
VNEPIQLVLFEEGVQSVLNGMYYEKSSGKFVSFVLGRRHFEVTPGRCLGDKEWKDRIMRERAI